jgi:hypothetical protein
MAPAGKEDNPNEREKATLLHLNHFFHTWTLSNVHKGTLLPLVLLAVFIHWDGFTSLVHRVQEEVAPDGFVGEFAAGIFNCGASGDAGSVSSVGGFFLVVLMTDVGVSDQATAVFIRGGGLIYVDDRTEFVQVEHFPRSAIMVRGPASVEDVREAKVAVGRRGGREALPGFEVVARAREHHDSVDLLVLREPGGRG